jgi:hypothetical protein
MEDYPRTLEEFEARFATEAACRDYLVRLRWPDGFSCPRCGHESAWAVGRLLLQCAACDYQASVTAGTIFQDTHKPLGLWFRAIWHITSQKTGASALGLQRVLGLGSYQTAWTWLHKLRRAMVRPGRDRLDGRVEVDETYVGGWDEGQRGRPRAGATHKALVVIAAQENGPGIGRIRMRRVGRASAKELIAFVGEAVQPGAVVHTDGWNGYATLKDSGYRHSVDFQKDDSQLLPSGSSRGVAIETLAVGHPPRGRQSRALGLLLGRVHVPVQPASLRVPRQAFLPASPTNCGDRSGHLRQYRPKIPESKPQHIGAT